MLCVAACRAIGVHRAVGPERQSPDLERHPKGGSDDREVQLHPQNFWSKDGDEEDRPTQRCARVPVSEPGDDRKHSGSQGIGQTGAVARALRFYRLPLERLNPDLGSAVGTEVRGRINAVLAARTDIHRKSLPPYDGQPSSMERESYVGRPL